MSEKPNNSRYIKEIETELSIDGISLNKKQYQNNYNLNTPSTHHNKIYNKDNILQDDINILLNSLQEFFSRYISNERKIFSRKKIILSFQELSALLSEAILIQQKIDKLIYTNNITELNIQKITQDYINDLSYNIFSFERISIDETSDIRQKKIFKPNINKFNCITKKKKSLNNSQLIISPRKFKNNVNQIFEKVYQEVFVNGNNSLNASKIKNIEANKYDLMRSKNIYPKLRNRSAIFSKSNFMKSKNMKSMQNMQKNKTLNNSIINNNINYNNNNININNNFNSHDKKILNLLINNNTLKKSNTYKNIKVTKNKNSLGNSDIFSACNTINKSGNKRPLSKSHNYYQSYLVDNNGSIIKRSFNELKDILGYDDIKFYNGIRRITVTNAHKPSNYANKLLISGQKTVDDYQEMNESAKKKKYFD